jgi:hypothetical protein
MVGATLSDARFEAPHLLCSIAIWSADAIKDIENEKRGASVPLAIRHATGISR